MDRPLTDQQLDDITAMPNPDDIDVLVAEVRRLRTELAEQRGAVLLELAALQESTAATDVIRKRRSIATARRLFAVELRGLAADAAVSSAVPRPSAPDCDPPHVRAARYEAAGNVMAASLVRDGFGDDEITTMLRPGGDETAVPQP